jgi:hypothetical protein
MLSDWSKSLMKESFEVYMIITSDKVYHRNRNSLELHPKMAASKRICCSTTSLFEMNSLSKRYEKSRQCMTRSSDDVGIPRLIRIICTVHIAFAAPYMGFAPTLPGIARTAIMCRPSVSVPRLNPTDNLGSVECYKPVPRSLQLSLSFCTLCLLFRSRPFQLFK